MSFETDPRTALAAISTAIAILYGYMSMRIIRITRVSRFYEIERTILKKFLHTLKKTSEDLRTKKIDQKKIIDAGAHLGSLEMISEDLRSSSPILWFVTDTILNSQSKGNRLGETWRGTEEVSNELGKSLINMHECILNLNENQLFYNLANFVFTMFSEKTEKTSMASRNELLHDLKRIQEDINISKERNSWDIFNKAFWDFFEKWMDVQNDMVSSAIVTLLNIEFTIVETWDYGFNGFEEEYGSIVGMFEETIGCITGILDRTYYDHRGLLHCLSELHRKICEFSKTRLAVPNQ